MLKLSYIGGLGLMASPAARHLKAGGPAKVVSVLDRGTPGAARDAARDGWRTHGAALVGNLEQLLEHRPDVIVMCAGKNGDDAPLISAAAGACTRLGLTPVLLHMSTVSAGFAQAAHSFCSANGLRYANYPLTGGPTGAALGGSHPNGMLILASGSPDVYSLLEPTLKLLGHPRHFGERIDAGALVKLIGQHLVFNGCIGISSAAALYAESFCGGAIEGSEQAAFFDFLNGGAGGTRQWEVAMKKGVADGVWDQGFMIKHAAVDAVYAADAAMSAGLSRLAVDSMLSVALAFSYLLNTYPAQDLATHAIVREMISRSSASLDEFITNRLKPGTLAERLQSVIDSFPVRVRETVALEPQF